MKKVMKLCMVGIVSISVLGACSFGKTEEPRNGAVIIGEEQRLKDIVAQHKSEIKSNDLYKIKRAESDGKQVLIIDQKTAEGVMKKGVLRKTDHQGVTNDGPITSLPTIPKGKVVMFTSNRNKEIKEIKVNDKKINVQYEDDISLGRVRASTYEDIILIVDATTFKDLPGTETYMDILHFHKSYGENIAFNGDDAEAMQEWREWEKVTKDMKEQVNSFDTVSIIKK
ncbi:lipoprotein BA_5634 family protein [Bacillus cereus group sp. MYBK79-1]|uniref:lipoprotein BA_5634 family protein n=1 Tax=unclassified Bacillus cereus group TaxID=2750818 RepID=UPI003F7A851B